MKSFDKVLPKVFDKVLVDARVPLINPILALDPLFYFDSGFHQINAYSKNGSGVATFGADRSASEAATRIFKSGNSGIETVETSDTERFVSGYYNETGYHPGAGLLLERQSTNMIESVIATAGGDAVITSEVKPCPFGNVGREITFVNGDSYCQSTNIGAVFDTEYFFTFYIKKGTKNTLQVALFEFTGPSTTTYTTIIANALATASTDEYQKYEGVATATHANSNASTLLFRDVSGDEGTVEICGLQVTELPFSSTIPSVSSTMQRNAETLTYNSASNFNKSAGTWAIALRMNTLPEETSTGAVPILSYVNGNDYIYIRCGNAGADRVSFVTRNSSGSIVAIASNVLSWTDRNELHTIIGTYGNDGTNSKVRIYADGGGLKTSADDHVALASDVGDLDIIDTTEINSLVKSFAIFNNAFNQTQVTELDRRLKL